MHSTAQICGREVGCKRPHDPSFSFLAASLTKFEGLKMAEAFDDVGKIPEVFSIPTDRLFPHVMFTLLADRESARLSAGVPYLSFNCDPRKAGIEFARRHECSRGDPWPILLYPF